MNANRIKISATIVSPFLAFLLFIISIVLVRSTGDLAAGNACLSYRNCIFALGFMTILLSWLSANLALISCVSLFIVLNASLLILNARQMHLFNFVLLYAIMYGTLLYYDMRKKNKIITTELAVQQQTENKNNLVHAINHAGLALESYFSRYSNYFTLREVANRFSTTLSHKKIDLLIVEQTLSVLRKGDVCLLYLADMHENMLSLRVSKAATKGIRVRSKIGSIFDRWVLKTRQPLIVTDCTKDVRFGAEEKQASDYERSIIAAPLLHDGKVIGTLRLNAREPECFSTDDLRLLNIMAILASSAIGNAILFQKTEELAIRDSLTDLYVHRYFKERLLEEHRRSLISNAPLTLLMCDLDHFKSYNDQYGHAAGDLVLQSLANIFIAVLGNEAFVARYGGEEFAVILPNINKPNAIEIAEEIRRQVEQNPIDIRGLETRITVSIGVSSFPDDTLDCEELILKADRRLYDAKRKGRNQVC
jgi:diguanylate cyclase (GGDEF)-like protein